MRNTTTPGYTESYFMADRARGSELDLLYQLFNETFLHVLGRQIEVRPDQHSR